MLGKLNSQNWGGDKGNYNIWLLFYSNPVSKETPHSCTSTEIQEVITILSDNAGWLKKIKVVAMNNRNVQHGIIMTYNQDVLNSKL